jgi:hypothetical protein
VLGLAELGVPSWLSALMVAVAVMVAGYVMATQGMSRMRTIDLAPHQTIDTLKETASWTNRTRA